MSDFNWTLMTESGTLNELPTKEVLLEVLRGKIVKVVFEKANSEKRIMNCTLRTDLLPKFESKNNCKTVIDNSDVVRVYDLDKGGWRSFRIDSLIEFN